MQTEFSEAHSGRAYEVNCDEEQEPNKVLVVLMAQAVIDVHAMVIESLHASLAVSAVESLVRLDYLAVETEVLQVNASTVRQIKQLLEVVKHHGWITMI